MHHGVGILHALTVRTGVFLHDRQYLVVVFLARPVALQFAQHLNRGHRHGAGLFNPTHGRVVRDHACAAAGLPYFASRSVLVSLICGQFNSI
jgi:hypothetical protein